jgi:hypothetical protein
MKHIGHSSIVSGHKEERKIMDTVSQGHPEKQYNTAMDKKSSKSVMVILEETCQAWKASSLFHVLPLS